MTTATLEIRIGGHYMNLARLVACVAVVCGVLVSASCNGDSPSTPTPTPPASCAFTVGDGPAASVAAAGGEFTVSITTTTGCAWSATSGSPFITVNGANTGSGNGSVKFTVQPNTSAVRQGTVQVANRSISISQDAGGCSFTVSPTDFNVAGHQGTEVSVTVTASAPTCPWQATSHHSFVVVATGDESGTGSGTVRLGVVSNVGGGARAGTASIAGRTVTIQQEAGPPGPCVLDVWPTRILVFNSGGTATVNVTDVPGGPACPWTAQSQTSWVGISGASSGTGVGTTTITIQSNFGGNTRGTSFTIAGRTVFVVQAAGILPAPNCFFLIANVSIPNVPASGGTYVATLTKGVTPPSCSWTAQVQDSFLSINPSSGVDGGSITIQVAPNPGYGRYGAIVLSPSGDWIIVYQHGSK